VFLAQRILAAEIMWALQKQLVQRGSGRLNLAFYTPNCKYDEKGFRVEGI
jgi:hypothetical protein